MLDWKMLQSSFAGLLFASLRDPCRDHRGAHARKPELSGMPACFRANRKPELWESCCFRVNRFLEVPSQDTWRLTIVFQTVTIPNPN